MGPPVRLVCIECLESVELESSGSGAADRSGECPHCGAPLSLGDAGIASRAGPTSESPPTILLDEGSTLRSDPPVVAAPAVRSVGRFQVRQALGEGGYGQVFRAYDPHLEREVALKVLKPNRLGPKALERFFREARAAARLDHPGIVGLFDAGRDEGRCWIAYQLVGGQTLSTLRDMDPPSVVESLRIVRDLALALHHAHGRGIFHRDLKPANVMIDESGRPRLTDFGLARRDDVASDLTAEGTVLGTPQYMSPEAAAGRAHQADARSDVYSLGVILYELLCGRRPCDLPTGAPLWRATPYSTPPTPRSVDRSIPPALDRICMKALAFDPADRHADAAALAEALAEQLDRLRKPRVAAGDAGPTAPIAPRPRGRHRHARRWAIAALAGVLFAPPALFCLRPLPPTPALTTPIGPADHALIDPAPPTDPAQAVPDPADPEPADRPPVETSLIAPPTPPTLAIPIATPDLPAPAAKPEQPATDPATSAPTRVLRSPNATKFHHPGCQNGPKIKSKAITYASAAEAIAQGYTACEHCKHRISAAEHVPDAR